MLRTEGNVCKVNCALKSASCGVMLLRSKLCSWQAAVTMSSALTGVTCAVFRPSCSSRAWTGLHSEAELIGLGRQHCMSPGVSGGVSVSLLLLGHQFLKWLPLQGFRCLIRPGVAIGSQSAHLSGTRALHLSVPERSHRTPWRHTTIEGCTPDRGRSSFWRREIAARVCAGRRGKALRGQQRIVQVPGSTHHKASLNRPRAPRGSTVKRLEAPVAKAVHILPKVQIQGT